MRNFSRIFLPVLLLLTLVSCQSTKTVPPKEIMNLEDHPDSPPLVVTMPRISFRGDGIKYECENMLLKNMVVVYDKDASGLFAAKILDDFSSAQMEISFPKGTYECLVSEKAPDAFHSAFYVTISGNSYRVYPSNPPLGHWELTVRAPIYFTLKEDETVLVTIKPHSENKSGNTGMDLDFIQFIKRK